MPYARKFYRRRPRKYTRRPRKSTKSAKKPSKFLKRTIQSMISKNVEDKESFYSTGTNLVYHNSGINSSGDLLQILNPIYNGSTESHRIGDTIRAKTLVIKGYIQLLKDQTMGDVANKRIGVRLMCISSKRVKEWNTLYNNFATSSGWLLRRGNTTVPFSGYINDLWTPVNSEEFTVHYDKVHYLAQDYVAQQVGSSTPTTTWSQDISKGIKFFTIRIPMRGKRLMFDSNVSGDAYPTNWTAGLCLGYAHLDGSVPDVVETKVGICYDATFTYEDA